MWGSAAVLVVGLVVFLAVFFSRGNSQPAANISTVQSLPVSHPQTTTPLRGQVAAAPAALQNARTFLETAVLRKNLDAAYPIVGPFLKGGISLKAWRTGNIPVQPYPAMDAATAKLSQLSSTKSELYLRVVLNPRQGSSVKQPQAFDMRVDHIGGKWLVNAFTPEYKTPIEPTPGN